MSVLHFKTAVVEHHAWWERFEKFLHGHTDDYPLEHVQHDHLCTIGQWLHGAGNDKFAHLTAFQNVKALHGELHDLATKCWHAKVEEAQDALNELLEEVKRVRHDMFMAWGDLNDIIGAYD